MRTVFCSGRNNRSCYRCPAEDTTASSDETKETSAGAKDALKGVKLKFGTTALFAPFTYYDTDGTTLIGFDIDMMNALKDYLGFELDGDIQVMDYSALTAPWQRESWI